MRRKLPNAYFIFKSSTFIPIEKYFVALVFELISLEALLHLRHNFTRLQIVL